MLALFGPLCKTARKERSAMAFGRGTREATRFKGARTSRAVIGLPASSLRINRWGCRDMSDLLPKATRERTSRDVTRAKISGNLCCN